MANIVYLDYAATTPCDPEVLEEMLPFFSQKFGNPNSLHEFGTIASRALSESREKISKLIGAEFEEVIYTSGATESNKTAIVRTMQALRARNGKDHFLTLKTEHKSVLQCTSYLKSSGFTVDILDVKEDGLLDIEYLKSSIKENTGMLSICFVNNETGVMQNIKKIAEVCRERGVLIHLDATQGFGKIDIDVRDLDIDFMSASAHKIYGPKGVGLLFYKKSLSNLIRIPRANNGVEFGIRIGTVPVVLCVGFAKAAELSCHHIKDNLVHVRQLREQLITGVKSELEEIYVNGSSESNYPGIVNISLRGCEGEALMMEAKRIAVSSGSACTSDKLSISHVLAAMKVPADIAQSSLRFTIGKNTSKEDINIAIEDITKATTKLRKMSPIWDMIQSGIDINSIFERQR